MSAIKFVVVASIVCASLAYADTGTLTLIGTPAGSLGSVYTSPYEFELTYDGTTYNQYLLACDTFTNEIYENESWNVNVYNLSSLGTSGLHNTSPSSPVYLPGGSQSGLASSYTIAQQYEAAAELANEIMNDYQPGGTQNTEDLSYAVWQIFDPSASNGLGSGDLTAVAADIVYAFNHLDTSPDVTIFTPTSMPFQGLSDANSGYGTPQEFIGITSNLHISSVPEAATASFLGFALLGISGAWIARRRLQ